MFNYRPYQQEAIDRIREDLKVHKKIGAILPTGAGKTEIFVGACDDFLKENPQASVLVLSHLSILTEQTGARFRSRAPHLRVGVLQAEREPGWNDRVIISTMQSARVEERIRDFQKGAVYKVGLIIVDEAHYLTTDSYDKVLSYFKDAKLLGVTATPFRDRQIMLNAFEKVSFSISLQELITQGYLVAPELHQIEKESDDLEYLMGMVVGLYRERERGKKAIVFMRTIEDAKTLRNALVDSGVQARAVTSELIGDSREEILRDFVNGPIEVLTTVNVLSAGFDAPNVEAIFMPYPTDSPTMYMQRIGRGLRPFPGKESCRVYVCGDSPSIARSVYQKIQQHVLNGTTEFKEFDTYAETLAYNHPDGSEVYNWTVQIVDIVERMREAGAEGFARLLNKKKFPKKFMDDLARLMDGLENQPVVPMAGPATQKQTEMLSRWGFPAEAFVGMTKGEASGMIGAIMSLNEGRPFVVKQGKYTGKHVSELPWAYKNIILNKFPHSAVAKMLREWQSQTGRRA